MMDEREIERLFKESKRSKPSDTVWLRIKSDIEAQKPQCVEVPSFLDGLRNFVGMIRPSLAALCLVVLLGVGFVYKQNITQQEPYLASLMDSDSLASIQGEDEVVDGITTYFL